MHAANPNRQNALRRVLIAALIATTVPAPLWAASALDAQPRQEREERARSGPEQPRPGQAIRQDERERRDDRNGRDGRDERNNRDHAQRSHQAESGALAGPGQARHATPQQQRPDASYAFRNQDETRLRQHYHRSLGKVDRDKRPRMEAGRVIAKPYRGHITDAPPALLRHLPPPPKGYRIGYYQGYTVVYDPISFVILSVIDLLGR